MALPFETFEEKLIEARKLLHAIYLERELFDKEHGQYKIIEGVPNYYVWQTEQHRIIEEKGYNCSIYLRYYAKGDYKECERIINLGWAKNG